MNKNISKTAQSILDLRNGSYKAFSKDATPEMINQALRVKMNEMLPEPNANGRYNYRKMSKALPQVFEIWEEVLDISVNDAWNAIPFYNEFVDSRNVALGDKPQFIIEPNNWISINEFSGNYWRTDRQKLTGKKAITVETRWFAAHVYDDFER